MISREYNSRVGFLRGFFSGLGFVNSVISYYPTRDPEEVQLVEQLCENVDKFFEPLREKFREWDKVAEFPKSYLENLKQMGLFGLIVPEEYGGLGLSSWGYSKVIQTISQYDASTGVMLGAHSSIGLRGIIMFGNTEQKQRYLPSLATGDNIACFCLTEPGAGSDAASIQTTAKKEENGDWVINGQKIWITNAPFADVFTVFARTDSPNGQISAFILERSDSGLSVGEPEDKMGIRASKTASVYFENVRVGKERLLGEEGKGFKIAMSILNNGRTGLAGGAIGGMKRMLQLAYDHAENRKQFGKALIEFDLIKEKILRIKSYIYAVASLVDVVSWMIDSNHPDYALEAACLKVFATDALWEACNEALQVAGGNGYMKEYEYERFTRDSRINRIFEGSNEILRLFVSLNGFKAIGEKYKPLKSFANFYEDPIKGFGLLVDYFVGSKANVEVRILPELKSLHSELLKLEKASYQKIKKVAFREGGNVVGKQMISLRVSEIVMWLFTLTSALGRWNKSPNNSDLKILEYLFHLGSNQILSSLRNLDKPETDLVRGFWHTS